MSEAKAPDLLNVEAAADYLGVSVSFVRRLVLEKRVAYFKVGKFVRFLAEDLDAFALSVKVEPVADLTQKRHVELFGGAQRRSTTRTTKAG